MEHTIAALATPPGEGGLAVVRISGERAYEVAGAVFHPGRRAAALQTQRAIRPCWAF